MLVYAGSYVWKRYWFNLFLDELQRVTLGAFEQQTFEVKTH